MPSSRPLSRFFLFFLMNFYVFTKRIFFIDVQRVNVLFFEDRAVSRRGSEASAVLFHF